MELVKPDCVTIEGVVTDFEITFTCDLFKVAWENNDFVIKVSIPQKKMAMVLSKIQVSDPGHCGPPV